MTKILSTLLLAAFAFSAHAQAASHAGGAPMKADMPASAASGAKMMDKKHDKMDKKHDKKAEMKKDDMKKDDMKKGEMKK